MTQQSGTVLPYLYAASCGLFAADFLSGPEAAPYNGKFLIGRHHVDWSSLVNEHSNLCILAARGHGKSHFWTFAYPLWQCMKLRGRKFGYIFSGSQSQANEKLATIKSEIENNPKLRFLKPQSKKQWSADTIELTTGLTIYSRGYGSKVRGGHPDFIVCQPPTTKIVTRYGMKRADELVVGDEVWTHKRRWRAITKLGERKSKLHGYKISGYCDIEWATPDHAFWTPADRGHSEFSVPNVKDWVFAPIVDEVRDPHEISKELFRVLGLFLGDGTINWAANGKAQGVTIYASDNADDVARAVSDAGLPFTWHTEHTCKRGYIADPKFAKLCATLKIEGNSQKRIPWDWEFLPREKSIELVRGYFEADGCISRTNDVGIEIKFTSVAKPMLESFQRILLRLGITSSIRRLRAAKEMIIDQRRVMCQETFDLRANWDLGVLLGACERPQQVRRNRRQYVEDGILRRRVEQVVVSDVVENVISFTVDEDHSYSGHLICSHNCDDVLNDEDAYSEPIRRRNSEYFYTAVFNMLEPDGQIVVVGTPFSAHDLYGELAANKHFHLSKFPAILDEGTPKARALWPERFSIERLQKTRETVGELRFARELMCCRPGTMIETDNGVKTIETIQVGDCVLSHTGNYRRVLNTTSRNYTGQLVRVKSLLHITPNHPVYTQDGWIYANDLTQSDQITFPKPIVSEDANQNLSLIDGSNIPYLLTATQDRAYARGSAVHLASGSVGAAGKKSIPTNVTIDNDLMYLFGLWLAEGFSFKNQGFLSFGSHELETLASIAVSIIESKFGITTKTSVKPRGSGGTATVGFGNALLVDLLVRLFGKGAGGKCLSALIRNQPVPLLWHLLLGYLDGDGHIDHASHTVKVSSVSRALLHDIQFVLARCGIVSMISLMDPGGAVVIQGRRVNTRPKWALRISGGSVDAIISRRLPKRAFQWSRVHGTLDRIDYTGPVYNFEVEIDNSYVADGVAVHNCEPVSSGASLFPNDLFIGDPVEQYAIKLGMPLKYWERLGLKGIYIGVDFSLSANAGEDFHTVVVIGVDKYGNRWVIDIDRQHRLSYQAQLSNVVAFGRKYKPELIYVESVQAQRIWGEELIRLTDLPIHLFFTTGEKHSLENGVPALRLLFDHRKLRLPRGDEHSVEVTDQLKEEFKSMAIVDGKVVSTSKHDDLVMGFYICNAAIEAGNFAFSFGEEAGDEEAWLSELQKMEEVEENGGGEFVGYAESVYDRIRRSVLVDGMDAKELAAAEARAREEARRISNLPPRHLRAPTASEISAAGPQAGGHWSSGLPDGGTGRYN